MTERQIGVVYGWLISRRFTDAPTARKQLETNTATQDDTAAEIKLVTAVSQLASSDASLKQCSKDREEARINAEIVNKTREKKSETIVKLSGQIETTTLKLKENSGRTKLMTSKL